MLCFTAINDSHLTDAAKRQLEEQASRRQALLHSIDELKKHVLDALAAFKERGDHASAFETLSAAFELPWEEAMQAEPECKGIVLLGLKLWIRCHPACPVDEILHSLELFPDEVDFWRHLVDALASCQTDAHPLAVKAAWEGLNCRVLFPERLDVLAQVFLQLGDVERAQQLDPHVKPTPVAGGSVGEEVLAEVKVVLHDGTPNGYALWLLKQYDLFVNGGRGRLESLCAPLTVNLAPESLPGQASSSSQADSQLQSSQGASQVNSPAKKRRPVRRMAQRRSQDLDKTPYKTTLADVISEHVPSASNWLAPVAKERLKGHLALMNEQGACLVDRIVAIARDEEGVSFGKLRKLVDIAVNEFKCKSPEALRRAALYFPLSVGVKALEHLAGEPQLHANCLKYTQLDKALQLLDGAGDTGELARSSAQLFHKLQSIQEKLSEGDVEAAREKLDRVDTIRHLDSPSVDPELKELLVETICSVCPAAAESLFRSYHELFWFPTASALPHCSTVDPETAASLLLKDPSLPVHQLIWHIVEGVQDCLPKMLEYLDQNSMLLADHGELAGRVVLGHYATHPEIAWNLLLALYGLPGALNVEQGFTSGPSTTLHPSLGHLDAVVAILSSCWSDGGGELNIQGAEEVLKWVLHNVRLPSSHQRILDLNLQALKRSCDTPSRVLMAAAVPARRPVADTDGPVSVHAKAVRLLYEIQVEQFANKRRSPDWLQSFKSTLRLHWSVFGDRSVLADLALCFHAVIKYSLSTFDPRSLAPMLGKVKRKLKKAMLCFAWANGRFVEQLEVLEVLEWSLQPGLLQFDLPDRVRRSLTSHYIRLLCTALEADHQNWRLWYLLAEVLHQADPVAALKPVGYALWLSANDPDAQCLVYSLHYSALGATLRHSLSQLQQQAEDVCAGLEKFPAAHRLVHTLFRLSGSVEVKERCLTVLFPFIAKPRVVGLSQLKASSHDRLGDLVFYQEKYLLDAIDFYKQQASVSTLLNIGQRVKTCGTLYLLRPEGIILAVAEAVAGLECTKEDDKRTLTLLRDLPKSDRLQSLVKQLSNK